MKRTGIARPANSWRRFRVELSPGALVTTDHIVMETLTLIQTTVTRNAQARAVRVGEQLYSEKLARIYRTTFEEQLEAFAYLRQHKDKDYSSVDCLSFVVMLKLGIQEAWTFDDHFSHRFIARPGKPK